MKVVVIVEDTDTIASSLALAVETIPGVKAVVAPNPHAALRLFQNGAYVAAIVTDLNLPFIDGFQLIGEVRKLHAYKDLPAIMITADEYARGLDTPLACRPNVILHKPFSPKEVCRVLESFLL